MVTTGPPLRIQLLGPVRAWWNEREVALGPPKQRAVLALLASRAGDVVGVENIVDAVWGSDIPHTAANGVHTYVAGLRRA
ncbi:AfsR/SARP family transcriptional regulator, partial [Streptomyces rubiginosohelvolus]